MKNVVITGSTRGIGFGLADAFLMRGCQVMVNGRSPSSVDSAIATLVQKHDEVHIAGQAGDVADLETHQALWDATVSHFGRVDIWVNNAGLGHDTVPIWEIPAVDTRNVVDVNILGLTYGTQVAMQGMLAQGFGQIYNLEGFGSNGRTRSGLSLYGASKAAVSYLTRALIKEAKETPVQVGMLQPGMVITDLVMDRYKEKPAELEKAKGIFNIIADTEAKVTPWLAEKILANKKHGARFTYLPTYKLIGRFITAPFSKRDLFA